jgi:hypothetical protein
VFGYESENREETSGISDRHVCDLARRPFLTDRYLSAVDSSVQFAGMVKDQVGCTTSAVDHNGQALIVSFPGTTSTKVIFVQRGIFAGGSRRSGHRP